MGFSIRQYIPKRARGPGYPTVQYYCRAASDSDAFAGTLLDNATGMYR
jgi:hypothetical protein